MNSRLALVVLTCGLAIAGCSRPTVLPPPTASIPGPPRTALPNPGQRLPPNGVATSGRPGRNPWRPNAAERDWKYVVIHHTATTSGSVESIHESHLKNKDKNGNPWLGIGYHFVIGNGNGMSDGAIEPTFRWKGQLQGAHAGSANKDYNERGIGVCLVGNFENSPPSAAQRRSVKLLVQTLKAEYGISTANVVGHKEVRASATECPGKFFPMAEIAADDPEMFFGLSDDGVPLERLASNSENRLP